MSYFQKHMKYATN